MVARAVVPTLDVGGLAPLGIAGSPGVIGRLGLANGAVACSLGLANGAGGACGVMVLARFGSAAMSLNGESFHTANVRREMDDWVDFRDDRLVNGGRVGIAAHGDHSPGRSTVGMGVAVAVAVVVTVAMVRFLVEVVGH